MKFDNSYTDAMKQATGPIVTEVPIDGAGLRIVITCTLHIVILIIIHI